MVLVPDRRELYEVLAPDPERIGFRPVGDASVGGTYASHVSDSPFPPRRPRQELQAMSEPISLQWQILVRRS